MINIADRLYDQKMKTRLLPVIYAVYVHVDWSALQMGLYLCNACHAVQWRGKKNFHMMQCTCTRKEGDRTHVRSDKGALHVDTISDIPSSQNSVVTAPIRMAENAIFTLTACEIRRHEIGWLTAACFGFSFVSSFCLSVLYLTLIYQFIGYKIATG